MSCKYFSPNLASSFSYQGFAVKNSFNFMLKSRILPATYDFRFFFPLHLGKEQSCKTTRNAEWLYFELDQAAEATTQSLTNEATAQPAKTGLFPTCPT